MKYDILGYYLCDISYVGRLFVKYTGKPVEILTKLNEMAGNAPDDEIDLYEVSFLFLLQPFQLNSFNSNVQGRILVLPSVY